jgi:hypothetical protein
VSTANRIAVRRSPVRFAATPLQQTTRDGWDVVLQYPDEGDGPWLVDLSHRARWDFQDLRLDDHRPLGLPVPPTPGDVSVRDGMAIMRMNRTQVALWHLGDGPPPVAPAATPYTETTDGHCMLAFVGPDLPSVMEHLTNLDLFNPALHVPRLTQGPVLHVPCQVVTFSPECVVMTFSRGYGQPFADAVIESAAPVGLKPGGEEKFLRKAIVLDGP